MSKKKFLIAVAIPLLILLGLSIKPVLTLMLGEEILLETRPVDPRDIFRGDYVRLDYKIEEVPLNKFPEKLLKLSEAMKDNRQILKNIKKTSIYGVLKKEKERWVLDYISLEKPSNKIYIKGRLPSYYVFVYRAKDELRPIHVDFGLDKYFVQENTGERLEKAARKGEILAKVKVLDGYAILTDIEVK